MVCRPQLIGTTAVALFAALVLSACSGGGAPAGGSDPADIDGETTDEDLSLMILTLEELGPEYSSLSLDPADSGFSTNEDEIADEECEPDEERADIERFGRLNGYGSSYSSGPRIEARTGVFSVGTEVDLYTDTDGAAASFDDDISEAREMVGTTDCEGFTAFNLDEFATAETIGDKSVGLILEGGDETLRFYATAIAFRRRPLVAFVAIADFDSTDHRVDVEALARKLDDRIQAVLRGEVSTPADSDSGEGQPDPITRDEAVDLLPRLVLQPEDVPQGLNTTYSGLRTLDDVASLQTGDPELAKRLLGSWEFVLGYLRAYGRDRPDGIFDLGVEVWALANVDNAGEAFIDGALLSNYPDVQYEEISGFPAFGDDSAAFRLSGEQIGPDGAPFQAEGYEILIRVDNFLALLGTTATAGQVSQAEVEALASALAARMRGE